MKGLAIFSVLALAQSLTRTAGALPGQSNKAARVQWRARRATMAELLDGVRFRNGPGDPGVSEESNGGQDHPDLAAARIAQRTHPEGTLVPGPQDELVPDLVANSAVSSPRVDKDAAESKALEEATGKDTASQDFPNDGLPLQHIANKRLRGVDGHADGSIHSGVTRNAGPDLDHGDEQDGGEPDHDHGDEQDGGKPGQGRDRMLKSAHGGDSK